MVFCSALFVTCLAAGGALAQWVEAGPYTSTSTLPNLTDGLINSNTLTYGMPTQGDPVYGGINTVLESPTNPNTYWVGAVGGGIWMTTNAGKTWTPTGDNLPSLAIGALALDSADTSGQTLYAGTGQFSNFQRSTGVPLDGLMKSTNGGTSWNPVAGTGLANYQLNNSGNPVLASSGLPDINGIIASGNTLLVSAYQPYPCCSGGAATSGGLFYSNNGGTSFSLVSGFGTAVTDLTSATINGQNTIFAARVSTQYQASTAVLYSSDGGATWHDIIDSSSTITNSSGGTGVAFGSQNYVNVKVAAGVGGSLFVAVAGPGANVSRLYYTPNFTPGQTPVWYDLGQPKVIDQGQSFTLDGPGFNQANTNFVLVADPNQKGVAYLAGSGYFPPEAQSEIAAIFRVNVSGSDAASYTALAGSGASPPSSPHSDSRALYFNASGQLIVTNDGGIYIASSPQSSPSWSAFGGVAADGSPIRVTETYAAVIDPATGRVAVAMQDNGLSLSQSTLTAPWQSLDGGDGWSVGINAKTNGPSIFYGTNDSQYLNRVLANTQLSSTNQPTLLELDVQHAGQTYYDYEGNAATEGIVLAVNEADPTKLLFRSSRLYTWQDPQTIAPGTTNIILTDISSQTLFATYAWTESIAYGTQDAPDAVLAGGYDPNGNPVLYLRTQAQANASQLVGPGNAVASYTGGDPTNVVFDPRTEQRFFAADNQNVYGTNDLGAHMTTLTLPSNFVNPNGLAYILNNGVGALVVGGARGSSTPSGNVIATQDAFDGASTVWQTLMSGMPNVVVQGLSYSAAIDTLVAATLGRGVWLLYDVTSNFASATVLQFGLANNDSNPDASLLTDGTVGSRPLIKYGTGTLTITGDATYSGSTTVNGGMLEVDGTLSDTSTVTVNSGGLLSGAGTVDPLVVTINSGATFAPGAPGLPGTSMTIVGNLAFQSGAAYLVQLNATASTFATVTGTAALDGGALAIFASGTTVPAHQYTILQSAGLNGTTFASLGTQNLSPNFAASLGYTPDDVLLNINAALGAGTALNGNQQSATAAINNFFNNGGSLSTGIANLFNLSGSGLQTALTQIAGEASTGAERGAFDLMNAFLGLMLDPFVDGRAGSATGAGALGFAPDRQENLPDDIALAYAGLLKAPPKPKFTPIWTTWASAYGGSATANGDPAAGSNNVTTSTFGYAAGLDYHYSPDTVVGVSLSGGGTNWNLANALGTGRSDALLAGVYGVTHRGPWYLGGALAFANNWFTTSRTAMSDPLSASFQGQSYSARLEGGYRFAVPVYRNAVGVTPYAAIQVQDFQTPSYSEADLTGGGLGLSYNAMSGTDTRSELGGRLDDLTAFGPLPLVLRAKLAWAHDWASNPALNASFESLPGASFTVNGAPIPQDSVLTSAGGQLFFTPTWSLLAKFDGEFANGYQLYAGSGTLRHTW